MLMFRVLVLTLALSSNQITDAYADGPEPLVVHCRHVNGPEVVFRNRYVGLVGYTVPGPCPLVGGIVYSDHYSYGPEGRTAVDRFTNCPLRPAE